MNALLALISPLPCRSGFIGTTGILLCYLQWDTYKTAIVIILTIITGSVVLLSNDELRLNVGDMLEQSIASGSDEAQRWWMVYLEKLLIEKKILT